jgi:hypothetical protein
MTVEIRQSLGPEGKGRQTYQLHACLSSPASSKTRLLNMSG